MSRKWFRFLVLLSWVLCAAVIAAYLAEKPSLPPELQGYLDAQTAGEPTARHWVAFFFLLVVLAYGVVITVGLYRFRPWARGLFLWGSIAVTAVTPFVVNEPAVTGPFTGALMGLGSALYGFTLALLFFSPVARYFDRESQSEEVPRSWQT